MTTHRDGEVVIEGLPFAWCSRCCSLVVLGDDGLLRGEHLVPCGRVCDLSAGGDAHRVCNGWCDECRAIVTGCAGDYERPCGVQGCGECGVHVDASQLDGDPSKVGVAACVNARSSALFAWVWERVTCCGCIARRGAQ